MKLEPAQSIKNIATLINARIIGDSNHLITGINEIHRVTPGDLTFVDHPKYYDKALNSAATFILINKEVEAPHGKALLFSDDPFRDYVYLCKHFMPFEATNLAIHPSSHIGEGTIIQPNVSIGPKAKIGKNCLFPQHLRFGNTYRFTKLGKEKSCLDKFSLFIIVLKCSNCVFESPFGGKIFSS